MAENVSGVIKTGNKAIATTGTAVQLSTGVSGAVNGGIITAAAANSGIIYIGGIGVTNTAGVAGNGYPLAAGASMSIPQSDLSGVYINGTAGDYVSFIAV